MGIQSGEAKNLVLGKTPPGVNNLKRDHDNILTVGFARQLFSKFLDGSKTSKIILVKK